MSNEDAINQPLNDRIFDKSFTPGIINRVLIATSGIFLAYKFRAIFKIFTKDTTDL